MEKWEKAHREYHLEKLKESLLESLPEFFTAKKAEERLAVNEKSLANLRSLGKGPAYVKRNRKVFYIRESFVDWLLRPAHFVEPL